MCIDLLIPLLTVLFLTLVLDKSCYDTIQEKLHFGNDRPFRGHRSSPLIRPEQCENTPNGPNLTIHRAQARQAEERIALEQQTKDRITTLLDEDCLLRIVKHVGADENARLQSLLI